MSPTHRPDAEINTALRALDAAPSTPLDQAARVRARADLDGIVAQPRTYPGRAGRDPLLPRRPRTARRVGVLALAAGIAVLGVNTSQVLGGGTAYADSWAPVPTAASPTDAAAARQACVADETLTFGYHVKRWQTRLVERRGDLVLVVLDEGSDPVMTLTCLVDLPPGGEASFVAGGAGGGARPAADAISVGGISEDTTPGDELSVLDGLVGENVAAVTVHAQGGLTAQATVQGGHYAAWWPGRAMRKTTTPSSPGVENNCEGECRTIQLVPTYTLDVTLRDGTVLRDVSGQPL